MRRAGKTRQHGACGIIVVLACALAAACSGGKRSPEATEGLRVAECEDYGRRMAACFDRGELATAPPILARDEAERQRFALSCSQSLTHIAAVCP